MTQSKYTSTGYELYRDAERVVIATMNSSNEKTGNMVQVWILAAAESPTAASKSGADSAVCGDCKHRQGQGGACYVTLFQGPLAVYKTWQRGSYPFLETTDYQQVFQGRRIRLGAYGDPAFIPARILRALVRAANGHTGYTHQWAKPESAWLKPYVMASVDSVTEYQAAKLASWRTFRVTAHNSDKQAREIPCPAAIEQGKGTTCEQCRLCSGSTGPGDPRKDIVIQVHGVKASKFAIIQIGRAHV